MVTQRERSNVRSIDIDVGVQVPTALRGMRRILSALQDVAPEECARIADDRPAEWNQLFPGSYPDVTSVTDLALTPSERRLHRESEQMFRILDVAARAIVAALTRTGHTLVLRNTGACDIVTLRGVMRAVT